MGATRILLFDFGNTLAPFNSREAEAVDRDIARFARAAAGAEEESFLRAWRREREADFVRSSRTGEEHDFGDRLLRLLPRGAGEGVVREAEARAVRSFVRHVSVPHHIRDSLAALARRYRMGVLSNYLLSEPIHAVLRRDGVHGAFEHVVVSKEVGYAKPDPRAFRAVLDRFGSDGADAVFIGDDRSADIEGALACGLRAVWTLAMGLPRAESIPPPLPGVAVLRTDGEYRSFLGDPRAVLSRL